MTDRSGSTNSASGRPSWLTNRMIGGLALVGLLLVFVVSNRDHTEVSFILFTAQTALWAALSIAGIAGFAAGFLLGRRRYRA